MENIKSYLNETIVKANPIKAAELRNAIFSDYLSSGIMLFNNDATAPFVTKGELVEILSSRILEGQLGKIAMQNVENLQNLYTEMKNTDKKLSYTVFAKFNDVGDVSKTYKLFIEAMQGRGEISRDFILPVPSDSLNEHLLKEYETLIATNAVRFEAMFEEEAPKKNPNKDAVATLATILTLRAIAQEGEEDAIDNLAEQLYPYLVKTIKNAGKKYMGDKDLYGFAEYLAMKRIEEINKGLNRYAIVTNLRGLRADERIWQEANKYNNRFTEYNINFDRFGSNPSFGYVGEDGKIALCDLNNEDYALLRTLATRMSDGSIDTDEEVFSAMFANLLAVENSKKLTTKDRKQLAIAFALPLIQAMNKLGDEKSNILMKEALDKLVPMYLKEKKNETEEDVNIFGGLEVETDALTKIRKRKPITEIEPERKPSGGVATQIVEITPKPKKNTTVDAPKVRKALIKAFTSENAKAFKKIVKGNMEGKDVYVAYQNNTVIEGIFARNIKKLQVEPQDALVNEIVSEELPIAVVKEFTDKYLIERTEEIVKNQDTAKDEIKKTKTEIGKFYKSRVVKGEKPTSTTETGCTDIERR